MQFSKIIEIYNNTPLRQSPQTLIQVVAIYVKLLGMHSDHCSKEKKSLQTAPKEKKTKCS